MYSMSTHGCGCFLLEGPNLSGISVVGFAFALRPDREPNPCNRRIGSEVIRVRDKYNASFVATQWEVTKAIEEAGGSVDLSFGLKPNGEYLSTRDVWEAAKRELEAAGIRSVVPVAQPFLHMWLIKRMIRKDGYTVVNEKINRIGYDNSRLNVQWWTRSAPALMLYSVITIIRAILARFGVVHARKQFD